MKKKFLILPLLILFILFLSGCGEIKITDYTFLTDSNGSEIVYDTGNNSVYYEIFVGAYSDSDGDGIGDINGLINRLDYLNDGDPSSGKSLGVDGIWLMPIMKAGSYHKYDVIDYMSVDSSYGTNEDMINLVNECNDRNMHVIIDLVLNHTSTLNAWFKTASKAISEGDYSNKYISYYSIVTEDQEETGKTYYALSNGYYYEANFDRSMPELNLDNEDVKAEISEIIRYWMEDVGVYGFRLDAVKYFYLGDDAKNIEFLKWVDSECQKYSDDYYLVGEDWSNDGEIASYYEAISCFDFGMSGSDGAITSCAKQYESVNSYVSYLSQYRNSVEIVNPDAILTPFISNHDMNRAAGYLSIKEGEMQMAANLYILTYGTPFIYYGEEIGMKGSRGTENTDANRRLAMLWGDNDTVEDPVGATYDSSLQTNGTVKEQKKDKTSLYNYYKKLLIIRKCNPEIALGEYTALNFANYTTFGGFLSTYEGRTVGVFHNTSYSTTLTIDLSKGTDFNFTFIAAVIGSGDATLSGSILTIAPHTSVILR
ncbi:MAG: alpha amylase [Bacillales bacterium]|nr:alpha amylase [Bacillales bacterium]